MEVFEPVGVPRKEVDESENKRSPERRTPIREGRITRTLLVVSRKIKYSRVGWEMCVRLIIIPLSFRRLRSHFVFPFFFQV